MGMFGKRVMLNGSEVDGREPIDDFSKLLGIISSTSTFDSSKLERRTVIGTRVLTRIDGHVERSVDRREVINTRNTGYMIEEGRLN